MGDNSEYRLLSISIRKPPKYGSVLSKDSTQKQNFITHNVQENETLQGIALKYNVSMEKIKRANNLWTSDSLFIRPTLSIPIDKPNVEEDSLNATNDSNGLVNSDHMNRSHNNMNSSSRNHSNDHSSLEDNSAQTKRKVNNNESNNNQDFKISLNDIQANVQNSVTSLEFDRQPSTSSSQNLNGSDSNDSHSNEMLRGKDESMENFLSRIDQYIKKSKLKMDSFANSSEIIHGSQSDDNIFKLHNYGHKTKAKNFRQHSLRNNEISLNEIRDKHNHESREIVYSLRRLEKEQEEREKYEL